MKLWSKLLGTRTGRWSDVRGEFWDTSVPLSGRPHHDKSGPSAAEHTTKSPDPNGRPHHETSRPSAADHTTKSPDPSGRPHHGKFTPQRVPNHMMIDGGVQMRQTGEWGWEGAMYGIDRGCGEVVGRVIGGVHELAKNEYHHAEHVAYPRHRRLARLRARMLQRRLTNNAPPN